MLIFLHQLRHYLNLALECGALGSGLEQVCVSTPCVDLYLLHLRAQP
jgi:hypothetical protein